MIDYKSYKYALITGSRWMILYRTKDDYLEIYSTETQRDDSISMDDFNEIVDYFMNSGYDYLHKQELLHAIDSSV